MTHLRLRPLAGLAAVSAALGLATAAVAAPDDPAPSKSAPGKPAPTGAGVGAPGGPQPVPASDFRPVSVDISIADDAGQVVDTRSCFWTEPQDDDRPCLRFKSDPQFAFDAIEEAGGSTAAVHTVSEPIALDSTTRYSRRSDGTWLIRTRGSVEGQPLHNGMVCTDDGQRCVRFDSSGRKSGTRSAKAAAAKLRRKR